MAHDGASRAQRLQAYLQQDPDNRQLLADLADAQLRAADWDGARRTLARSLALDADDRQARYRLAVAERAAGEPARAAALLQELLTLEPAHPVLSQELALAQAQQGDWGGAARTLEPLDLAALPSDQADDLYLLRLRALHHLGELDTALALGQTWQAQRGAALPLQGLAALASLQLDAERLDDAEALVSTCAPAQLDSSAELLAVAGYVALAQGRAELAQQRFARGTALAPQLGRAHLGLGLAAASAGDQVTALQALRAATQATPQHLGSWHALAWMQLLGDDLDGVEASLRSALAQDRNFGDTHGGLALLAALRGDRVAAEEGLRLATRLDPQSMNAAVARILLAQPEHRDLKDPEVLRQGLEAALGFAARRGGSLAELLPRLLGQAAGLKATR